MKNSFVSADKDNDDIPPKLREIIKNLQKEIGALKSKVKTLENENKLLKQKVSISDSYLTPIINERVNLKTRIVSDIIISQTELDLISQRLLKHNSLRLKFTLVFKATRNGDRGSKFHEICDDLQNTMVIIKTDKGRRFGGFTTKKWEGDNISKKDDKAFIFSIDKMKVYPVISGEDAIGCYKLNGPDFCGWQIVIQDNFLSNKKCYTGEKEVNFTTTEDYEINGGEKYFGISEMEVFSLKYE